MNDYDLKEVPQAKRELPVMDILKMLDGLSPHERRETLNAVTASVLDDYNQRIENLESQLKELHEQRDIFRQK